MKKLLQSLRVFKRIRVLEQSLKRAHSRNDYNTQSIIDLQEFIASREPCKTCGHHRYRQKTLHNAECR